MAALIPPTVIVVFGAFQPWVPFDQLTRDPIAAARICARSSPELAVAGQCAKIHFGLLSNIGVLLWSAAASVCLYAFLQSVRTDRRDGSALFLAYAGIFSVMLMMDDFFLGHELIYPKILGLKEEVVFVIYGILFILYIVLFYRLIARLEYSILVISIFFFGISVFFDVYDKIDLFEFMKKIIVKDGLTYRIGEDGAKLIGIWTWTVFHVRAAWILSTRADKPPQYN